MSVIRRKSYVVLGLSREEALYLLRALGIAREEVLEQARPHQQIIAGVEATYFSRLRDRLLEMVTRRAARLGVHDLN